MLFLLRANDAIINAAISIVIIVSIAVIISLGRTSKRDCYLIFPASEGFRV